MQNFFSQFLTVNYIVGTLIAGVLINWISAAIRPGRLARWAVGKWRARSEKSRAEYAKLVAGLLLSAKLREKMKLSLEQQRFEAVLLLGVTVGMSVLFSAELNFEHVDMRPLVPQMSLEAWASWICVIIFSAMTVRNVLAALNKFVLLRDTLEHLDELG